MSSVLFVEHQGRPAAMVLDGLAIVDDTLRGEERRHVQAKCLYALEIIAGARPGPYRDDDANRFAARARRGRS